MKEENDSAITTKNSNPSKPLLQKVSTFTTKIQDNNTKWTEAHNLIVLLHVFHLFYAVIKKCQASILVTHKTALFNKAAEYLRFGEMRVELCIGTVSAF